MKKILVVMLAVLMALAIVSCQKDKSGEMVETFAAFMDAFETSAYAGLGFTSPLSAARDSKTYAVTLDLAKADGDTFSLGMLIGKLVLDDEYYASVTGVTSKEGTISGTFKEAADADLTFDGVKVSLTYDKKKDEEIVEKGQTITIEINGTYKSKMSTGGAQDVAINLTINGKACNYVAVTEFDANAGKNLFTVAKVNGKDVNLKVLNNSALVK